MSNGASQCFSTIFIITVCFFNLLRLPELQIRGALRIIQRYFFLFLKENICCDTSLEPSRRDGSNDGSQYMFLWRNTANYPLNISITPSYLKHCIRLFPDRGILMSIYFPLGADLY